MARCKYLHVASYDAQQIQFSCTDKATLDWLVNEVQKYCSRAKINDVRRLPNGEPFYYKLGEVYTKTSFGVIGSDVISMWLIKQLLEQRWEPLGESISQLIMRE
jgi:hypothetical protein